MALKTFNPTSPGLRQLVLVESSALHKCDQVKALNEEFEREFWGGSNLTELFAPHIHQQRGEQPPCVCLDARRLKNRRQVGWRDLVAVDVFQERSLVHAQLLLREHIARGRIAKLPRQLVSRPVEDFLDIGVLGRQTKHQRPLAPD